MTQAVGDVEAGGWKLGVGGWRPIVGWRLEVGGWVLETGGRSRQLPTHNLQPATCKLGSAFRVPQSAIRNPQSAIHNPQSPIRNPQSAIRNPQSPTRNPPSPIRVPQSAIPNPQSPLLAIVGPTAVGKTALSLVLAQALGGEIVSADSRQIYRGMDIGTAKATPEERALVPHHLLDVVDPDQVLTLAEYQRLAYAAIDGILARGRLPLLVGGTGQYVRAVLEGWRIPEVAPQPELRAALEADAAAHGAAALHARLAALDPVAAARIDPRNVRRVIRALEVCLTTGRPISELQTKSPPPYRVIQVGVTRPRPELYARIDARVDHMIEAGLVDEVRRLADAGYGWDLPAMTGLGYRQIGQYLRGEIRLDEAIALIKRGTRRFVQQQYNWFRLDDPEIHWIDAGIVGPEDVLRFLSQHEL